MSTITSPDDESLDQLCDALAQNATRWQSVDDWPEDSLRLCAQAGVFRWFFPKSAGGLQWSERDCTRGYLRLAEADLTTTFVITQYMGAIRRIVGSPNQTLQQRWAEQLMTGDSFGTVGISHLTTSGRHLSKPVLLATETEDGFLLDGMAPWVTGAPHADVLVTGAVLADGRELLAAVPSGLKGIEAGKGVSLVAMSASCTDRVTFTATQIDSAMIIAGPSENVMQSGVGGRAGGLQTSTLALGLSRAAAQYLQSEADVRDDLKPAAQELTREVDAAQTLLLDAVSGETECDNAEVRMTANRLALRTTQAAMTAAKGAGFVEGHRVGRWLRQAMFFLVWSCPTPVAQAHLCELAGIE